jgi:hypothetical protein
LEKVVLCSQWKAQHGLVRGPDFFFLGLGRGGGGFVFLLFSLVPVMFHMCSHKVPQVLKLLPKTFPIAPQFYPIWFAQSSTLMYINWKGKP